MFPRLTHSVLYESLEVFTIGHGHSITLLSVSLIPCLLAPIQKKRLTVILVSPEHTSIEVFVSDTAAVEEAMATPMEQTCTLTNGQCNLTLSSDKPVPTGLATGLKFGTLERLSLLPGIAHTKGQSQSSVHYCYLCSKMVCFPVLCVWRQTQTPHCALYL